MQKQLAEEFVHDGDFSYYLRLKTLYDGEEWKQVYQRLLEQVEDRYRGNWRICELYLAVLVEEKESAKLLQYIQENKSEIVKYYPHLIEEYADKVFVIFSDYIMVSAQMSSTRSAYIKVCELIMRLKEIGGKEQALQIMQKLRLAYSRRPAFMEELRQITS
ncbi:hypothetical protein [Paenibacillus sp. GCM10027626]|uniref:hypothetical protein n=1 Tax=Paenibacillus sp. GCM10027626 TaxID=3273411 RepID=UPI0036282429